MDVRYDIVIVGAGPGGITAAIYAARARQKVLLIEKYIPGGKLNVTNKIGNWPSSVEITGAQLSQDMYEAVTNLNVETVYKNVVKIMNGDEKIIKCDDGTEYFAPAVIFATGTTEKTLGLPQEDELVGRGLSYCAVCDAKFFAEKTITVIGGGNSAVDEAIYLTQFASKLNIVIRRDEFTADELSVSQLIEDPKVEVIAHHKPLRFITNENGNIEGLVLLNLKTMEELEIETSAVFPYIGSNPETDALYGLDILNKDGYVVTDVHQETKIKGIFGVGDVCEKSLRQIITAASDGAIAAQGAVAHVREYKKGKRK